MVQNEIKMFVSTTLYWIANNSASFGWVGRTKSHPGLQNRIHPPFLFNNYSSFLPWGLEETGDGNQICASCKYTDSYSKPLIRGSIIIIIKKMLRGRKTTFSFLNLILSWFNSLWATYKNKNNFSFNTNQNKPIYQDGVEVRGICYLDRMGY